MTETTATINYKLLASRLDTLVTRYNKLRAWQDLTTRAILAARAAGQPATGEVAAEVIDNKRPPSKQTKGSMYADASAVLSILGDNDPHRPQLLDLTDVGLVIDRARAALAEYLDH